MDDIRTLISVTYNSNKIYLTQEMITGFICHAIGQNCLYFYLFIYYEGEKTNIRKVNVLYCINL
ncbi:hypothetical protein RhiirC2_67002 [Rhizophagus irregularis]|uniref:Uncharacterized protein n=1 Tax=Rhizophagus irregularis TaxID=588596 RepID=A0A2N1NUB3_9GLOM|nr:hypothetical protein RhiirC2_67002 [Rhizophagus irregularis]